MPNAAAPLSGELRDASNVLIAGSGLGKGCLYFGGGSNTNVPGARIPVGSDNYFNIDSTLGTVVNVGPSSGVGLFNQVPKQAEKNCTLAADALNKTCVDNLNWGAVCTTDTNCGGTTGSCQPTAKCFFGPPIPLPNPTNNSLTTCVVNYFDSTPVDGTIDKAAGGPANLDIRLSSRVYLTANFAVPCPVCSGAVGTCSRGPNAGQACTAVAAGLTSADCRSDGTLQTTLPIKLNPLVTGQVDFADRRCATMGACGAGCANQHCFSDADCLGVVGACGAAGTNQLFCLGQTVAKKGAFGKATASHVIQNGAPPAAAIPNCGSTTTMELASGFCIGNVGPTIDPVAGLPGPGSINLVTNVCLAP